MRLHSSSPRAGSGTNIDSLTILPDTPEQIKELLVFARTMYPGDNPNTPAVAIAAEEAGYSFAGIMPHVHAGSDRLIMQQLNIALDLDKVLAYGEEGQELSAYVRSELEQKL